MKCQFCNREIREGSKFCSYCGKSQNIMPSGEMEQPTVKKSTPKSNKSLIIIGILLVVICVAAAGVFVFRNLSGGGTADGDGTTAKDNESAEGSTKMKKNVLEEYLKYIGTDFGELPDSFEHETIHEFDEYDILHAKKEVEYAGVAGEVYFEGYEFKESVSSEWTETLSNEIVSVSWQSVEQDDKTIEKILKQMNKDYGEYDGKEVHEIKDRINDPEGNLVMMEYTYYYWSNRGDGNYDIQLIKVKSGDSDVEEDFDNVWCISIVPCEGEGDSEYQKPLKKIEQACQDKDIELIEEAFAESFFESTNISREDMSELIEELQGSTEDLKVSFNVKDSERISTAWRFIVLAQEWNLTGFDVMDLREVYIVDASLTQTVGSEEEEAGELTIVIGKDKGLWKILTWETY